MLDDLERALGAASEHEEAKLEEGVRLVHRSLAALLERRADGDRDRGQVRPARARGAARAAVRGGGGRVIEVMQKGYALGDRVLRPRARDRRRGRGDSDG